MTTQTVFPSFTEVLSLFMAQFVGPDSCAPQRCDQMLILTPDRALTDNEWAFDFLTEGPDVSIDEAASWAVVVDSDVYQRYMQRMAEGSFIREDIADTDADHSVAFEETVTMYPNTAVRMALGIEYEHTIYEDGLYEVYYAPRRGEQLNGVTGGRMYFLALPEDWRNRLPELMAMVDCDGDPVYPAQLWDPPAHSYTVVSYY